MKKLSDNKKLIISAVLLAVFAAILAASIIIIATDTTASVPNIVKLLLFFTGGIGCVFCVTSMVMSAAVCIKARREDRRLIAAGLKQNPKEDVIRKPVEYDDEEGFKELEEHTEKFFENVVFPEGFEKFLKAFNSEEVEKGGEIKKVFIYGKEAEKRRSSPRRCCELSEVYGFEDLVKINKDILLYNDDYYTQFRDIVLFADDESGHCHFLLDYGNGGEPSVKYLDNELDIIIVLADTFAEFEEKLLTASQAYGIKY